MYILGILIGLYLHISIVFLLTILLIICVLCYLSNINKKYLFFIIIPIVAIIYTSTLNKNYEEQLEIIPKEANIIGYIIDDPEDKDYKYKYTIKIESINGENKCSDIKLILDIKKKDIKGDIPSFGDTINVIGTFNEPNGARNYKGFDYKQYLKSKNIYGTIEAERIEIIQKKEKKFFMQVINSVQNSIKNNMRKILGEEESALCIGILVGDRELISDEVEDNFKNSNLTHMLAVSGSHIAYIITALSMALGKTSKRFTKIFIIFALIFFMALTGFTASVMRASIMGMLVIIASLIHRKPDTINNLAISILIILIINPYTVTDAGFWLSYAGTIGILTLNEKINRLLVRIVESITSKISKKNKFCFVIEKVLKWIANSLSITLAANIFIIPIMAYMFSSISITFWISNILAGPVMEFATIYGFIIYFISVICSSLARFLGIILNISLTILLKIAEVSALIPGSAIYIKTPSIISCIFYYSIVLLISYKKTFKENQILKAAKLFLNRHKMRIISILLIVLLGFNIISNLIYKDLKIYFVDVGQGDSTLIKTPQNKYILIDGGGSEFGNFDVGKNTLLPYLLDRRITVIDYMLISHFDSDHIGGLFYIIDNLNVRNIIISKQGEISNNFSKLDEKLKEKKINIIVVKKGDNVKIDNYSWFEILFPEENMISENILNNNSIVANFHSMGFSMLFTGDIEEIAENRLCELYSGTNKLNATVLKVAHHGSKTSSTLNFLNLVKPKLALIGVGKDNNFGHPNSGVIDRIKKFTNNIYRTDRNGEIELIFYKGKLKVNTLY